MTTSTRVVQHCISERIDHLNPADWDALTAPSGVFLQRRFLRAFEATAPMNVSPRYALMYRDGLPLAAVALQLVHLEGRHALALSGPLGGVAQLVDERILVLGNLAGWGETGLAIHPGADRTLVWREVLKLVDRLRRAERGDGAVNVAMVKDAEGAESPERALRAGEYQRAAVGPDMQLTFEPSWKTFGDFLASFPSKRRRTLRKFDEDVMAAGYVVRPLLAREVLQHEARIDALYTQVWSNAEVRPVKLSGRFFGELAQRLGDDVAVWGVERDGRLDGFAAILRSGEGAVGYYLGYERGAPAPIYFRLLNAMVEQALTWGCRRISLGRTSEQPKTRLGAKPVTSAFWLKHRTPPVNWLLSLVEAPARSAAVAAPAAG